MTTIADIRVRLRKDLHDEDSLNYRWTDGELDRHIQHTVREFSLAVPLEAKTTLTTTLGSRDLSISALTDLVGIEAVEYPAGEYPPSYTRFSVWLSTLTLLTDRTPAAAEIVNIFWTKLHTPSTEAAQLCPRVSRTQSRAALPPTPPWSGRASRRTV